MKKMQKFLKWKFLRVKEAFSNFLSFIVLSITLVLTIGLLSLPGIVITFLFGFSTDEIMLGGFISLLVVGFGIIIIYKIIGIIRDYKNFNPNNTPKKE